MQTLLVNGSYCPRPQPGSPFKLLDTMEVMGIGKCCDGGSISPFLPVTVVEVILQHVPFTERLTVCALVCKAWADAAASLSVHVDHKVRPKYFSAVVPWLEQHGHRLCSLQLQSSHGSSGQLPQLQLPTSLQRLDCLHLHNLSLALPAPQHCTAAGGSVAAAHTASGAAGPVALLPRLQELKLQRCSLDRLDSIVRLTLASSITRLELCSVRFLDLVGDSLYEFFAAGSPMESLLRVQEAVSDILQQLPDLQALTLDHALLCPAAVQQVSAIPRLQELTIEMPYISIDGAAASLPSTLTRLELVCGKQGPQDFDNDLEQAFPHFLSGLHELTRLVELDLSGCTVNPRAISNMPGLQHLRLVECELLHVLQPDGTFAAGPRALLYCLPNMVHLRHLELTLPSLADSAKDVPELFAGLTASSHLTCLKVEPEGAQPLPRGAARAMFRRKVPQLEILGISNILPDDQELDDDEDEWCLDSDDLAILMACCRNLTMLNISRVLRVGADMFPLWLLPLSCNNLTIGGLAIGDAVAAILAHFSQLECLWVEYVPRLTDAGLNHLTALRGLYELCVLHCSGISKELLRDPDDAAIELQSSLELGSVCEQLKRICLRSPLLHPGQ